MLVSLFTLSIPADAQNVVSDRNNTETSTNDSNNKETTFHLPDIYQNKIKNFIIENRDFFLTKIDSITAFQATSDFVKKEMESDV